MQADCHGQVNKKHAYQSVQRKVIVHRLHGLLPTTVLTDRFKGSGMMLLSTAVRQFPRKL